MRQWLSLVAVAALLAGCATSPQSAPLPSNIEPAATETASSSDGVSGVPNDSVSTGDGAGSDPDAPVSSDEGASGDTADRALNGGGDGAGGGASGSEPSTPAAPPAETEPAAPSPSELLSGMVRVPTPALSSLPAAVQQQVAQISPWAAAEQAAVWRHGVSVVDPLAVAPALAEQLAPLSGAPDHVWTRLVSSWDEGDRYYFHIQMTRRDADGRMVRAGIDVVEVSQMEGGEPIVTGYAHAPWTADPSQGPVTVWVGRSPSSYTSPNPVHLPAPAVVDAAGRYQVPVAVLESLGQVEWLDGGSAALTLAPGSRSAAMATATVAGVPYVAVDDLIAAIDGQRHSSAEGSYTYAVEWRPDLGQLCLWQDVQHPIS